MYLVSVYFDDKSNKDVYKRQQDISSKMEIMNSRKEYWTDKMKASC